jgi:DNA-binding NarL/FixJ family response regulator
MNRGRWPLVGRESARVAVTDALAGQLPDNVVLTGPSGVGRTRMAREATILAEGQGRRVRWVTATAAAAQVPLGALAHLLPRTDSASNPLALLGQAAEAIAGDGTGPVPVLVVDDVHLLDQLSVVLLHQLAASRAVTLVLTVRSGLLGPDPTAPLWKDGVATQVELHPLDRGQTDWLLGQVVGGDLHTRSSERLWRMTLGVPLYLRELVEEGRRMQRFISEGGLWRWEGPMTPSDRLTEIVLEELGALATDEWRVLEALAAAEPLHVDRLMELSSPEAVISLGRRRVILDCSPDAGEIRSAHPLYPAVVRSRVSGATLGLLRRQLLADALGHHSGTRLVRRFMAAVDGELPRFGGELAGLDGALLTESAREALSLPDLVLAERLARAAVDAGSDVPARLVLLEATRWLGRPERCEGIAAEAARRATDHVDRARLAVAWALALGSGLHRLDEAAAELRRTAAAVGPDRARSVLRTAEGVLAYLRGDPDHALHHSSCVLASTPQDEPADPLATATLAAGRALTGQTGEALATVAAGRSLLAEHPATGESLQARMVLMHAEVLALHLGGRLDELERRTAEFHRQCLRVPEWPGDAVASLYCGWAAIARGQWRAAIRWLTEADAGLARTDPAGLRELCRALLVTGRAMIGDTAGATDGRPDTCRPSVDGGALFSPYTMLASASVEAAEGRIAEAGRLLLDGAALAARQGQTAVEALLLHHGLRFGLATQVSRRLRELARLLDAPLVEDFAAHAEAVAAADGVRLDAVSHRFRQCGALLAAADAALEAAGVHDRQGARRAAAESRTKAVALARECGLADTPALDPMALPTLTSREEEVASLATHGLSNQDIADKLVVSVRTVEAHLSHVYTKFGITSRTELVAALALASPARKERVQPRNGRRLFGP